MNFFFDFRELDLFGLYAKVLAIGLNLFNGRRFEFGNTYRLLSHPVNSFELDSWQLIINEILHVKISRLFFGHFILFCFDIALVGTIVDECEVIFEVECYFLLGEPFVLEANALEEIDLHFVVLHLEAVVVFF